MPASDVYALGLVLLECLKGEREYLGAPPEAGVARLLRPPDMTADIPEALVPLVKAMTRRDPRARPDADQCAHLLQAVAEADPRAIAVLGVGADAETATGVGDGTDAPRKVVALPRTAPDPAVSLDPVDPAPRARSHRTMAAVGTTLAAAVLGAAGAALVLTAHGDGSTPGAVHDGRSPAAPAAPTTLPGVRAAATPARPSAPARTTTAAPADGIADRPRVGHGNRHGNGVGSGHDRGKGKGQGTGGPGTPGGPAG